MMRRRAGHVYIVFAGLILPSFMANEHKISSFLPNFNLFFLYLVPANVS